MQSDFKDSISLKKLIHKLNRINKIDVLVNNAGINKIDNLIEIEIVKHDFYDSSISIKTPDIKILNLNVMD